MNEDKKHSQVLVLGSLNMDLVIRTPRLPAAGETIHGEDLQYIPGGKGANQAAAAALLGAQTTMIGRVGGDAFGEILRSNLAGFGVETAPVLTVPSSSSGAALILVDQAGENSIVLSSGANGCLDETDVHRAAALMFPGQLLVLQLEIPMPVAAAAAQAAKQQGVCVVLNPAPAQPLADELLACIDYLVPNEVELALLTGHPVGDLDSVQQAAQVLLARGVGCVVVTLGARGAMLVAPGVCFHVPAPKVEVVDTTAAGDAFIGGFCAALMQGFSQEQAVAYGCCAGALAVTRLGAQPSLPHKKDVDFLYNSI